MTPDIMKGNNHLLKIELLRRKCSYYCIQHIESQDEKSNDANIEEQNRQEGFIINLSKDQKSQYGSQFEGDNSEGPGIVGKFQIITVIYRVYIYSESHECT